jgi:hypothetical protein
VAGPTCVWEPRAPSVSADAEGDDKDGGERRAGGGSGGNGGDGGGCDRVNEFGDLTVVPAVEGRVLRFRGDLQHAVSSTRAYTPVPPPASQTFGCLRRRCRVLMTYGSSRLSSPRRAHQTCAPPPSASSSPLLPLPRLSSGSHLSPPLVRRRASFPRPLICSQVRKDGGPLQHLARRASP